MYGKMYAIGKFAQLASASVSMALAIVILAPAAWSFPVEGVTPINNREYGPAVQQLLQGARSSIHIMLYQARFYEEYPDTLTNHYVSDLIAAKKRGVDVNVLIDTGRWNPNNKNEHSMDFADRLAAAGVQVWEDSPEIVSHQKVICVDDVITVIASSNWSYYSLAKNNEVAAIVYSPSLNAYFKQYFLDHASKGTLRSKVRTLASASPEASDEQGLKADDLTGFRMLPASTAEPLTDRQFYPAVLQALLEARKSIIVVQHSITMYDSRPSFNGKSVELLPGEPPSQTNALVENLIAARKRGLRVKVVLDLTEPSSDDANEATAAYLEKNGVDVFREDPETRTHAKMILIDDDKTILGSTNWTYPAMEEGNEASVLITSPQVNKLYKRYVKTLLESGAPHQSSDESIRDDSPITTADHP